MKSRRTKLEIINDILISIIGKGGAIKPTHLLYKSNLSHTKMKMYLDELYQKNMIYDTEDSRENRLIAITEKGRKFTVEYKRVREFSEAFGF